MPRGRGDAPGSGRSTVEPSGRWGLQCLVIKRCVWDRGFQVGPEPLTELKPPSPCRPPVAWAVRRSPELGVACSASEGLFIFMLQQLVGTTQHPVQR